MSSRLLGLAAGCLLSVGVSGDCNGCSGTSCVELVDDSVYGCYGTFGSAIGAGGLCDSGYHMCESANEASLLGLTTSDCENKVPIGHHFWSLESSVDDGVGGNEGNCYSKNGPVTYNDRPRDDLWGCASSQTQIGICGSIHYTPCGPFNRACDAPESGAPVEEDGLWQCPCEDIELFTTQVTDASVGGIVCCSDTIPTDLGSGCDESITVWRINPGTVVPTPNFATYVGKYVYSGNTNAGYPRYINHDSGTEISLSLLFNRLVLTFYSGYDVLYSVATTEAEGVVVNAGNNRWEITSDFWSPGGTDMSAVGVLAPNPDHVQFYNPDYQTDSNNPLEEFQFIMTFSDCPWYGLENVDPPTPAPVPSPTAATPAPVPTTTEASECPNYDSTVYPSCNGDINCANCQPWGCAQCNSGYYKMGNLQRCQSCSGNYPNCAQCGDWNGCTSCNSPYQLQWNGDCGDETCQ